MGDFNPPHPVRKVAIPDHLWEAFEEMARQMGSERDGLINQALFMFARLNGFLDANGSAGSCETPMNCGVMIAPIGPE